MAFDPKLVRIVGGAVTAIVIVAAIIVFGIKPGLLSFVSKPTAPARADAAPPAPPTSPDVFMTQIENREAWYDHRAIATWVTSCLGAHSPENLPEAVRWALEPPGRFFTIWTEEKPIGELTSQHRAVIGLSNALFMERIDSSEKLGTISPSLEKSQVLAIIIGLLTTVFISLSSTDIIKDTNVTLRTIKISVKIFAIVLPAVGTAVTALNAVNDSRAEQAKYSRIFDSAVLLHRQIALGIASLSCAPASAKNAKNSPEWDKNDIQIRDWINAHKALIASSTQKTETATSGDISAGQAKPGGSQGSNVSTKPTTK
jgi:hypothetical protein